MTRALWSATVVLAALGIAVAVARGVFVADLASLAEPVRARMMDALGRDDPNLSQRAGEMPLKLAITALSLYLDKHFKNSREVKTLSLEPIAEVQPDTEMT